MMGHKWQHTIKGLRSIINKESEAADFGSDEYLERVGNAIADCLNAEPERWRYKNADDFRYCISVNEMDGILDDMYDWADDSRIWIDFD